MSQHCASFISAAGLVNSDAGDFDEDEANEGIEKDLYALTTETLKHTSPKGNFVACHLIEPLHDQTGHGGSGKPGGPENRCVSSITGREEEGIAENAIDDDEEVEEGGRPIFAKRRPGLSDDHSLQCPLRQPYHSSSLISTPSDLGQSGVTRCSNEYRWPSSKPTCQRAAKTYRAPSGDTGNVMSTASSIAGAELQDDIDGLSSSEEWPVRGFLKRKRIGSEEIFTMKFALDQLHHQLPSPTSSYKSRYTSPVMKTRPTRAQSKKHFRRTRFTKEEDEQLVYLKSQNLSWEEIKRSFPGRSLGTLQEGYYSTKLMKGS